MQSVRGNFFSNLAGTSASAAILILVTPIYLRLLGADAFGLLGVYITLTNMDGILDMGLTPALSREVARLSATREGSAQIRTTVRTLEVCYLGATVLVLAAAYQLLPLLATHWLKPSSLGVFVTQQCLQIMAVQISMQLSLCLSTQAE